MRKWLLSGERPERVLDVYRPQESATAPTELAHPEGKLTSELIHTPAPDPG